MPSQKSFADLVSSMGPNLRKRREDRMLSREELAKKSGVSANTIVRYEKGEIGKIEELLKLSNALGVGLLNLMNPEDAIDIIDVYEQSATSHKLSRVEKDMLAYKILMPDLRNGLEYNEDADFREAARKLGQMDEQMDRRFGDRMLADSMSTVARLPDYALREVLNSILQGLSTHQLSIASGLIGAFDRAIRSALAQEMAKSQSTDQTKKD